MPSALGRQLLFLVLALALDEQPLDRLLLLLDASCRCRNDPWTGSSSSSGSACRCTAGPAALTAGDAAGPAMTRSALAAASRSKRSPGSLTLMPPGADVPSTGPLRCCITWVSSWAKVVRPACDDGSYVSRWNTMLEPTV